MSRNLLALLALILLITVFVVLWDSPPEPFWRQPDAVEQHPISYLTDVQTTQYTTAGQVSYVLNAARVDFYQPLRARKSARDYTLIEAPQVVLFDADADAGAPPWQISAEHGRSNADGSELKLWSQVKIWRQLSGGEKSELSTSELVVKPDAQYAETDKPVMISAAGGTTRALGMKAYLEQHRIELLSNVRGVHEAK